MNTAYRAFFVLSLPPIRRTFEWTPWTKSSISQLKIALSLQTQRGIEADRDIHILLQKKYSFYQTLHLCARVTQKGRGFELYTLYNAKYSYESYNQWNIFGKTTTLDQTIFSKLQWIIYVCIKVQKLVLSFYN